MKQRKCGKHFFPHYLSIFRGSSHLACCYGDHVRMHAQAKRRRRQSGLYYHFALNEKCHPGNMSAHCTEKYGLSESCSAVAESIPES